VSTRPVAARIPRLGARADRRARPELSTGLLRVWTGLVYLFLYAPIVVVVVFAFNRGRFVSIWDGFSTRWFSVAVHDATIRNAVGTSLTIAIVSTAIATVLGTATAWALERTGRRARAATDAVSYMRIMLPELVTALGLLAFFFYLQTNGLPFLKLGYATVVIGHVTWNMTYVLIIVRARLAGLDPSLREAALDLGSTPWRAFRKVVLPDLWPGIAAGALLAFTFSFDDFVTTFFLAGPDVNTLPVQLFSMIRYGLTPEVNAISTLLLAITAVGIAGSGLLLRRGARR
jgi:spermidine/putrescine transport system permease protein